MKLLWKIKTKILENMILKMGLAQNKIYRKKIHSMIHLFSRCGECEKQAIQLAVCIIFLRSISTYFEANLRFILKLLPETV